MMSKKLLASPQDDVCREFLSHQAIHLEAGTVFFWIMGGIWPIFPGDGHRLGSFEVLR